MIYLTLTSLIWHIPSSTVWLSDVPCGEFVSDNWVPAVSKNESSEPQEPLYLLEILMCNR